MACLAEIHPPLLPRLAHRSAGRSPLQYWYHMLAYIPASFKEGNEIFPAAACGSLTRHLKVEVPIPSLNTGDGL